MDGGETENGTAGETDSSVSSVNRTVGALSERFSGLGVDDSGESRDGAWKTEKDPRRIARKYQIDLCKKAMEENIIVCLGTGCGKTHIAVLLIYEMGHLIKKPQKNICVFLAPTVALVQQQAKVIQDSIDFSVGTYCGSSKRLKGHRDWEKEIEQYEVLVMTPQILLHNLSHCFIRMELIALLIFDECHYAQVESNHPYAEIMKVFYKTDVVKLPRIFGMTASPILGKGASINSLETLLRAKVYSVEDKDELEQFVTSPKFNVYFYGPVTDSLAPTHVIYYGKLEEIKRQCVSIMSSNMGDLNSLQNTKKMLQRLHGNLMFCLVNLGVWGALQSCNILLKGDDFERNELIGENGNCRDNSLCDRYLTQASTFFTSHCIKDGTEAGLSCVEVLKEPFFSKKLMRLIGILSSFRSRPNMKCIIFVNRIITARSLSYILRNLKFLSSWKCDYLVGVHSGLKSMSRKNTDVILQRFRSGEVNLLVATKVGEEGLDIQTCCLVIRFDLPETISSFIQSRGRARMPQSEYAFLVDRGNQSELNLIEHFNKGERKMNEEIASRKASTTFMDFDETIFKIDSTGATISSIGSVSLLHHYCSKLPHDEYFNPKAEFFYFDDSEGIVCHITLPANAAIHQVASTPQSSMEAAKKDACLKACRELYAVGALTNYLLPDEDNGNEESTQDLSDSDSCDEDDSRRELHEMLVPAALREPWMELDDPVFLHSYYIKFCPRPVDRLYKKFGLFVKASLPEEAAKMQLDLCLARGRSVNSELQPHGVTRFAKDEISLAMNFQQMFLKIILDRSKFIPEFVSLENNDFISSRSSTCYLLLPVIEYGNTIDVDWKLIRRCLSSPIFRNPRDAGNGKVLLLSNHLILANGPRITSDIVNSLVYVPCKDVFFFVSDVVLEKDGYSEYKDAKTHVEHYVDTPYALSYPHQPLLKVKQLFCLDNLLRKKGYSESREKEEHFVELPPEICQLKVIGFSKDIGSSLSLLPSIMHRLESLLVAIELKQRLSASFAEAADVTGHRVLEALTTGRCNERFSLERLEVLGDAFLKFAVGRHLFLMHDAIDEGQLTRKRSKLVKNSNLCRLAIANNLQVYIRDQSFEPNEFFALGRSCSTICNKQTEKNIHSPSRNSDTNVEVRCSKSHHWLHKKTIADVVEALVGVFIVEIGFKGAADFLNWIGIKVDFTASQIADICASSSIFRPIAAQMNVGALENLLGYQFVHKGLLAQAFVHPSYNNNFGGCYQRLEFLGDAVLDYLITSYLYSVYPELTPGQLTDLRSAYVNNIFFAAVAVDRSFHEFMKYDSSFLRESINKYVNFIRASSSSGGTIEAPKCPKPLGDLVESTIGAILLDVGFDLGRVWNIMLSFLNPVMNFSRLQLNPVRELKELCQSHKWELSFPYSKKDKTHFSVEAKVIGSVVTVTSCSVNINKKAAKRMAAQQTLAKLKAQGYKSKSKPLEEVLKMTCKKEAKLIGYDEMPTGVIASGLDNLTLMDDQPLASLHDPKIYPSNADSKRKVHYKQSLSPNQGLRWRPTKDAQKSRLKAASQTTGESRKSAKSLLHEICAANCWKPPEYECCNETGPSHLKEFTYKVVVEIEEGLDSILECYGDPSPKKKDAAEHAAQGALWYLNHLGY